MKLALTDRMASVETEVEKANESVRTRTLDDAVIKSVHASTKKSAEAQGTTPSNNYRKVIDTRNL